MRRRASALVGQRTGQRLRLRRLRDFLGGAQACLIRWRRSVRQQQQCRRTFSDALRAVAAALDAERLAHAWRMISAVVLRRKAKARSGAVARAYRDERVLGDVLHTWASYTFAMHQPLTARDLPSYPVHTLSLVPPRSTSCTPVPWLTVCLPTRCLH